MVIPPYKRACLFTHIFLHVRNPSHDGWLTITHIPCNLTVANMYIYIYIWYVYIYIRMYMYIYIHTYHWFHTLMTSPWSPSSIPFKDISEWSPRSPHEKSPLKLHIPMTFPEYHHIHIKIHIEIPSPKSYFHHIPVPGSNPWSPQWPVSKSKEISSRKSPWKTPMEIPLKSHENPLETPIEIPWNRYTGVGKCPNSWELLSHFTKYLFVDHDFPIVGWCETLGHLPTPDIFIPLKWPRFSCLKKVLPSIMCRSATCLSHRRYRRRASLVPWQMGQRGLGGWEYDGNIYI